MGAGEEGIGELVGRITAELEMPMGRLEVVADACATLTARLEAPPPPDFIPELVPLGEALRARAGPGVVHVAGVLARAACEAPDPVPLVEALLCARDGAAVRCGLDTARDLVAGGRDDLRARTARVLGDRAGSGDSVLDAPGILDAIAALLRARPASARGPAPPDPVRTLLIEEADVSTRLLAARLLDLDAAPAPMDLAAAMLDPDALAFLRPYLEFTRAGHADLLHLAPRRGAPVACLESLRRAEEVCGAPLLREIVAALGWPRVCLGVDARRLAGVSVHGSIPLFVRAGEAPLVEGCAGARRTCERIVLIAHGGLRAPASGDASRDDPVVRYRAYNLAHAAMLQEILDVAPLTDARLARLVARMDGLVAEHVALFSVHAGDCAILPAVWRDLRTRIEEGRARESGAAVLSPELTRLVLAFEDAPAPGAVHTLHGLKRHLHQAGLRLGFRLVRPGRSTNRTVDAVVAAPGAILGRAGGIRYVDFEPDPEAGDEAPPVPYPVAIVAEGLARAVLHGATTLPSARVFRYGNEVQYFLTFRNHPAFVRVFFAPPLQGGMVDIEYYGVSRYELASHPGRDVEGVRTFFRRLEFDVQVDPNARIHARYDKEQARDLGDVCDRAEALFRLAPHLMDLDWVLGDLKLREEARRETARAWADRFVRWGVVPVDEILTRDRLGILQELEEGPAGAREVPWSGDGPYRDRRAGGDPAAFLADLAAGLAALDPDGWPESPVDAAGFGQNALDRAVLAPLREAVALGGLEAGDAGPRPAPPERYAREHEAEAFARMLESDPGRVAAAARVARIVRGLERSLVFRATGSVNGHPVQRTRVPLHGGRITLFVLRDPAGVARLALYARGPWLSRRRADAASPWEHDACADAARLAARLRAAGYEPPAGDVATADTCHEAAALRDLFRRPNPHARGATRSGERVVEGVPASPGRAVGRAVLGAPGRTPEDLEGAMLVARTLRPEDGPLLANAAGVISTGGGILSHAGLIATQYAKPALIVPGAWRTDASGSECLALNLRAFREQEDTIGGFRVTRRREEREFEWLVADGDLLVLDADREVLRILGRAPETLALHEGFRAFGEAGRRLAAAGDDRERLALRGARLRARHRIETVLARLADPTTARHALHEILLGEDLAGHGGGAGEKAALLELLLSNPRAGPSARDDLDRLSRELSRRLGDAVAHARTLIPEARTVHEVLAPRLRALRLRDTCREAAECLSGCGVAPIVPDDAAIEALEREAVAALDRIGRRMRDEALAFPPDAPALRHRLRELERLDTILGAPEEAGTPAQPDADGTRLEAARRDLRARDARVLDDLRSARVLAPAACGLEAWTLAGWKAANLAEIARVSDPARVPPWFAVTDAAFREVLERPPRTRGGAGGPVSLRAAIEEVLARDDMDARARAAAILALWEDAALPEALCDAFGAAFRALAPDDGAPLVAVRSSALAEDTELAAHAGEFDTFLFVRGEDAARECLKRAWAGLWNERALRARSHAPGVAAPGGGVIVQRMVDARVSGVLQTIHAASGDPRRMVVNAGLGLGEGVVSGAVAADLVTVEKEGDLVRGPLRVRYVTGDKRDQIVFDRRAGTGTVKVETLYHQRMRPALEYVELLELVGVAAGLEEAYGYPLDIEFAIERDRLWILQVRPVPAHGALVRETLERHPVGRPGGRPGTHPARRAEEVSS